MVGTFLKTSSGVARLIVTLNYHQTRIFCYLPSFNVIQLLCFSLRQSSLTPLHLAIRYGQESVVKLLLKYGANVNAEDRVSASDS